MNNTVDLKIKHLRELKELNDVEHLKRLKELDSEYNEQYCLIHDEYWKKSDKLLDEIRAWNQQPLTTWFLTIGRYNLGKITRSERSIDDKLP